MAKLTQKQRNAVVSYCKVFNAHQSQIGYEQVRPFPIVAGPTLIELLDKSEDFNDWDCSGSTVEIFHCAGLQDPTGFNFAGLGNTSTMLGHLKHYTDPSRAQPGALVIFGADLGLGNQHVAIVVEAGKDPELFSHGSANKALLLPLSAEQSAHAGSTVFLDVSNLG
jgi:hypothetical protein